MSRKLQEIAEYLDNLLDINKYKQKDRSNGLIIRGKFNVNRIAFAVNTTLENIKKANELGADLLIAHHGGWKETDSDMFLKKMDLLKEYQISLYIAHTPLDCHKNLGVSVSLAKKIGVDIEDSFAEGNGILGKLLVSIDDFRRNISSVNKDFKIIGELKQPSKVAVIGGGGATKTKFLSEARDKGCDIYVTGNSWFFSDIYAFESGMTLILLGETNSEKFGIYALSNHFKEKFKDIKVLNLEEKSW